MLSYGCRSKSTIFDTLSGLKCHPRAKPNSENLATPSVAVGRALPSAKRTSPSCVTSIAPTSGRSNGERRTSRSSTSFGSPRLSDSNRPPCSTRQDFDGDRTSVATGLPRFVRRPSPCPQSDQIARFQTASCRPCRSSSRSPSPRCRARPRSSLGQAGGSRAGVPNNQPPYPFSRHPYRVPPSWSCPSCGGDS